MSKKLQVTIATGDYKRVVALCRRAGGVAKLLRSLLNTVLVADSQEPLRDLRHGGERKKRSKK
jgi:hypothetical protein